jgi:MoxR-like ATPase
VNDLRDRVRSEIGKVVVGQDAVVDLLLSAVVLGGHVLLQGVPGVAKSLLASAFARTVDGGYRRVQFTPDMLPSDLTGTMTLRGGELRFRPGPVFTNVLLADEINRTPPKTQSALLEAMQEGHVSVDGTGHPLPDPFLVIATQNPIEYEGTYPLPEAQLDRFLLRLRIGYPDRDAELAILDAQDTSAISPEDLEPVTDAEVIASWSRALGRIHVAPELQGYIIDVVAATRHHRDLLLGVSPRGALGLQRAARALAASIGRAYVVPDDVKLLAPAVLEHRLMLSSEAITRGVSAADVLASILESVSVPTAHGL